LIWRAWRGQPATGIDRVCIAYLAYFRHRARAVIQRKGVIFVLSTKGSDRLYRLLLEGPAAPKAKLLFSLITALATARHSPPCEGMIYLNVGHTGLDEAALPHWLARHHVRPIYLVHDLIPLTHPEYCRAGEAEKHAQRMANVLASAAGVITNSRDTFAELDKFARTHRLNLPANVTAWISGYRSAGVVRSRSLERPYFVTVGTIEGRKNHLILLRAWERLVLQMGRDAPILVIIGQRGWQAQEAIGRLDRLRQTGRHVREITACSDQELAGWIAGARALLMPSFVEGFGLPIIEALQLGTPVIASRLPVFREIAGDIPTYLDPSDQTEWEETLVQFVGQHPERQRQLEAMGSYRAPTWEDHFKIVEEWLTKL
jgi:glycosyltransferase involved in cell wall biosynthesis